MKTGPITDRNSMIEFIQNYYRTHNQTLPNSKDMTLKRGSPIAISMIVKEFGTWNQFLIDANLPPKRTINFFREDWSERICNKCKQLLPIQAFNSHKTHVGTCNECYRKIKRDTSNNRTDLVKYNRVKQDNIKRRQLTDKHKNRPCTDCKQSFPPECMDFDHRPGEVKLFNVSRINVQKDTTKLLTEIAKCDVVCSNCHRVRTRKRQLLASEKRLARILLESKS